MQFPSHSEPYIYQDEDYAASFTFLQLENSPHIREWNYTYTVKITVETIHEH